MHAGEFINCDDLDDIEDDGEGDGHTDTKNRTPAPLEAGAGQRLKTKPEILTDTFEKLAECHKAKTGRPKLEGGVMEEALSQFGLWDSESETRRTLQNRIHQVRARGLLELTDAPEEFAWLLQGKTKGTILGELGRVKDKRLLIEMARAVAMEKMNTRKAVALIRSFRLGATPEPDTGALTQVILAAIDDYILTHRGVTFVQINDACADALAYLAEREDG